MNNLKQLKSSMRIKLAGLSAALVLGGLATTLVLADPPAATPPAKSDAVSGATNNVAPVASPVATRRELTGAELYSIHCNRCHPERYPTERTAAQWKTIMLHMQVRANLPGRQARKILQYLQENSGR